MRWRLTFRGLLLLILLVSVFCLIVVTCDGLVRISALSTTAWLTAGEIFLVHRTYRPLLLPLCAAPMLALIIGQVMGPLFFDPGAVLLLLLTIGLVTGMAISAVLAATFRREQ